MSWQVITADVLEGLGQLPDESVQTVVTSPPYWGLRDYSAEGQLGLEPTPEAYVARMVEVFREVRRVLRRDGTCWVNLGDSYAGQKNDHQGGGYSYDGDEKWKRRGDREGTDRRRGFVGGPGLKPKDLVGIPWRVAFALQADGWYLRSDVIWSKPNPMPESVTDRPTKAHEYVFLLTRSARYFYDADAVREPSFSYNPDGFRNQSYVNNQHHPRGKNEQTNDRRKDGFNDRWNRAEMDGAIAAGRNLRSVWSIPTEPFPQAHFATFPKALVVPCIKAGTSEKGACPECGAAWVRVVERGESDYERLRGERTTAEIRAAQDHRGREGTSWERGGNHTLTQNGTVPSLRPRPSETTGWEPGCECQTVAPATPPSSSPRSTTTGTPAPSTKPCLVLDPFAGSGTVGVVALRYGRSFVGIELNPEYAEMARNRIRDDGPLFNVGAEVPKEVGG